VVKQRKDRRTGCPVAFALDTFGDRWSLLIVRDILLKGSETYGEFMQSGEGIATNVLADRLKELEAAGIIGKSPGPDNNRRYLYTLTEKGCDLAPVIVEMIRWSAKYDPKTTARKEVLKWIEDDSDGFIAGLRSRGRRT
jgi:DNA-binding HxlR family transcriptional regulator